MSWWGPEPSGVLGALVQRRVERALANAPRDMVPAVDVPVLRIDAAAGATLDEIAEHVSASIVSRLRQENRR